MDTLFPTSVSAQVRQWLLIKIQTAPVSTPMSYFFGKASLPQHNSSSLTFASLFWLWTDCCASPTLLATHPQPFFLYHCDICIPTMLFPLFPLAKRPASHSNTLVSNSNTHITMNKNTHVLFSRLTTMHHSSFPPQSSSLTLSPPSHCTICISSLSFPFSQITQSFAVTFVNTHMIKETTTNTRNFPDNSVRPVPD